MFKLRVMFVEVVMAWMVILLAGVQSSGQGRAALTRGAGAVPVVEADLPLVEITPAYVPVYSAPEDQETTATTREFVIRGTGFHADMTLFLESPVGSLMIGSDYVLRFDDDTSVTVQLRSHSSGTTRSGWGQSGALKVSRAELPGGAVRDFTMENNGGIQVASIIPCPSVTQSSIPIVIDQGNTQGGTRRLLIRGTGFTTKVEKTLELSPTFASDVRVTVLSSETILVSLDKPSSAWDRKIIREASEGESRISLHPNTRVPVRVTAMDTGAGRFLLPSPATVGYIQQSPQTHVCDDSCAFAIDGVCSDNTRNDYRDDGGSDDWDNWASDDRDDGGSDDWDDWGSDDWDDWFSDDRDDTPSDDRDDTPSDDRDDTPSDDRDDTPSDDRDDTPSDDRDDTPSDDRDDTPSDNRDDTPSDDRDDTPSDDRDDTPSDDRGQTGDDRGQTGDSHHYAGDNNWPRSERLVCGSGTDCTDCATKDTLLENSWKEDLTCTDSCPYAKDGICDDTRGAGYCDLGTDCSDCGPANNFTGVKQSEEEWWSDDDDFWANDDNDDVQPVNHDSTRNYNGDDAGDDDDDDHKSSLSALSAGAIAVVLGVSVTVAVWITLAYRNALPAAPQTVGESVQDAADTPTDTESSWVMLPDQEISVVPTESMRARQTAR